MLINKKTSKTINKTLKKTITKNLIKLVIILLLITTTNATNIEKDVEIKIIIKETEPNTTITKIFKTENLNHVTGQTDNLNFLLIAKLYKYDLTNFSMIEEIQQTNNQINETNQTNTFQTINNQTTTNQTTNQTSQNMQQGNYTNTNIQEFLIEENLILKKTWNTTRTINKFTETGFGELILNTGIYYLCAEITPINYQDPNQTNNKDCKTIHTTDIILPQQMNQTEENETQQEEPLEETDQELKEQEKENKTVDICECELKIITNKKIYDAGETITFAIQDCWETKNFENEIRYWAEDLFETTTRNPVLTKTKTQKSYTPNIKETEKTLFIKAKIDQCEKTQETIVIIKNIEQEQKETNIETTVKEEAKNGEIIIIDLKGYKGNTQKTLITTTLLLEEKRVSEEIKTYIQKTNTEFHFKIPLKIPENLPEGTREYTLKSEGLDQETENTIIITTNAQENKETLKINNVYTRKQKYEEDINIIINWEGAEEAKARITTQKETKEIQLNQTPQTIPIKIKKPNETIITEIIQNNETKDIKLLKLNLEHEENTTESQETTQNTKQGTQETTQNTTETNTQNTKLNDQETKIKTQTTTQTINTEQEEQKNTKEQKNNNLTANTINIIKEQKKQITFAIITIMAIILLFYKEIKKTIKKRKKLIKKVLTTQKATKLTNKETFK